MMSRRRYLVMLVVLASTSCASHKGFVYDRNFDIGRSFRDIPIPDPIKIEPIDDQTSRYIFEFKDTGCRWAYTVDNKTMHILSWQYISEPDRCYTTIDYLGPW